MAHTAQPRHNFNLPQLAAPYNAKPSIELGAYAAAKGAGAGLLVSAVQNALDSHSRGAAGVLSRTGGTVGLFGRLLAMLRWGCGQWNIDYSLDSLFCFRYHSSMTITLETRA